MKQSNQFLSVEKSQELIKLGLDGSKTKMIFKEDECHEWAYRVYKCYSIDLRSNVDSFIAPIFTTHELLELLPSKIRYKNTAHFCSLGLDKGDNVWTLSYSSVPYMNYNESNEDLLELLYLTLKFLLQKKYLCCNNNSNP